MPNIINGTQFSDRLVGRNREDLLFININDGIDVIQGFSGDDLLEGRGANDQLYGGEGNDRLDGGDGIDSMYGGSGFDVYTVDHQADRVVEFWNEGIDIVQSSAISYKLEDYVEDLTLLGSANLDGFGNNLPNYIWGNVGNNTLVGGEGADTLYGGDGVDRLFGVDGSDFLNGGIGADFMQGGLDSDIYIVDNVGDRIIEAAFPGIDTVYSSVSYRLSADVENLTLFGTTNSYGVGNNLNNIIVGNSGNNTLIGGAGFDRLDGGEGADLMEGGQASDRYIVDNVGDRVVELFKQGNLDYVESFVSYTLGDNVERLNLLGTANLNGTGNDLANTLIGNVGRNTLVGGKGADSIRGEGGDDWLLGGDDSDFLDGGIGRDWLEGRNGDDQLFGNLENDTLIGGAGNDRLSGGAGDDTLLGGSGPDRFSFESNTRVLSSKVFMRENLGIDTITSFERGSDKIELYKPTFTTLASRSSVAGIVGFSDVSEFAIVASDTAAAISRADIVYNSGNGKLFYNPNGLFSGFDLPSVQGGHFATLAGAPSLSSNDFCLTEL